MKTTFQVHSTWCCTWQRRKEVFSRRLTFPIEQYGFSLQKAHFLTCVGTRRRLTTIQNAFELKFTRERAMSRCHAWRVGSLSSGTTIGDSEQAKRAMISLSGDTDLNPLTVCVWKAAYQCYSTWADQSKPWRGGQHSLQKEIWERFLMYTYVHVFGPSTPYSIHNQLLLGCYRKREMHEKVLWRR